ncbi:MAG: M48 family metalloprotease [Gemmatimonadetes bacterium]|nr:M48 family metalloprotease [Gemmatimonadota bacterium]
MRSRIPALAAFVWGAFMPLAPVIHAQTIDERIGAEGARQVLREIGVYETGVAADYVRAIGNRLVVNVDDDRFTFKFNLLNQSAPNAFALPGGWVYVSRGLLILANSEDELAGVIGHEMAHVTNRHGARRQRRGVLAGILEIPGAIVGAVVDEDLGNLLNVPIVAANQVTLSAYSRGQETEADLVGIRLAGTSGYDPEANANLLSRLEQEVAQLSGREHRFSLFDTHPATANRVLDIREEVPLIDWTPAPPIAADRADFLRRMDGVWFGADPGQGMFDGQRFLHPEYGLTIRFPDGWNLDRTVTTVSAYASGEDAVALVGLAPDEDPATLANEFIARLRREHGVEPTASSPISTDAWSGYYVTFLEDDLRGGERSYLHYAWVRIGDATYQLVGAGPSQYEDALRQTALSLRPMTEAERESISGVRVRIVTARPGETLAQLGTRTDNEWSAEFTGLLNSVATDSTFAGGELLKIARMERFR